MVMTTTHELDTNARGQFNMTYPSEMWDDDFEFQQDVKSVDDQNNSSRRRSDLARDDGETTQGDGPAGNAHDKAGPSKRPPAIAPTTADHLRAWSESPISNKARGKLPVGSEENWDDDFMDKPDSPVRATHRRSLSVPLSQENWDEDFEMGVEASPGAKRTRNEASWDSSDEEDMNHEFGFGRDEEDKTVTQKSRRRPLGALNTDIPPVPPLPNYLPTIPSGALPSDPAPFPRSPTMSVFSIPTTISGGRDSASGTYGSTHHLRRTYSAGSSDPSHGHHQNIVGRFPPVSPNHGTRERRRLRKKSRPPHLENNIIELDDRAELTPQAADVPLGPYAHLPFRPVTPENRSAASTPPSTTLPVQSRASSSSSSMALDSSPAPPPPTTSPPPKSPLLTRLGSVKRWSAGTRKKRASTGPSEVVMSGGPSAFAAIIEADRHDNNKTPRPHSSYIQSTSSPAPAVPNSRFFRDISGSSGNREDQEQTHAKARLSASSEGSRDAELKKGKHKPDLQVGTTQGVVNSLPSPRKLRIKALGSKLIPSGSKAQSTGRTDDKKDADGDTRMVLSPSPQPSPPPPPSEAPQTPSRVRPRLPPQAPSALQSNRPPAFPRHTSASVTHEPGSMAPSPSARSVSASVVQERDSITAQTPEKKEGSRGFMGSMRRISLVGGQKRHKRGKSGGAEDMVVDPASSCPTPVPSLPGGSGRKSESHTESGTEPSGKGLLPALELGPSLQSSVILKPQAPKASNSSSLSVDIGSPIENPGLAPLPRRSGEPTLSHSKSSSFATPPPSRSSQSAMARLNASPSQAASLGRASQNPTGAGGSASSNVHRRNSLGDLKIPSRISRAQDGLKRDLTRVREFAAHVESMKDLRSNYYTLATQIQSMLEIPRPPSRTTSPTSFFNFSRPVSRARSNTNPPPPPRIDFGLLALSFRTIDSKYRIAWECAELLIDLGTGATTGVPPEASPPAPLPTSKSDPASVRGKNRERAITLAGDEGKPVLTVIEPPKAKNAPSTPPALLSWRASTGRHDLNQRQLFLLKEMLNNAESAKEGVNLEIPEHPQWRLGEGMESNLTLPTEESATGSNVSPQKKRPSSRLGMTGIRDMLRSLKRHHSRVNNLEAGQSSTTLSTESSLHAQSRNYENHPYLSQAGLPVPPSNGRSSGRRRSKTSAGPDSVRSTAGDYPHYPHMSGISLTHKSSPRRPSLASLFRIGQKHKGAVAVSASPANSTDHSLESGSACASRRQGGGELSRTTTEEGEGDDESDWDRMDSLSDVDVQSIAGAEKKGTLKLKRKKRLSYRFESPSRSRAGTTFRNPFSSSQASLPPAATAGGTLDPSGASTGAQQVQILSTRLSNVDENAASVPRQLFGDANANSHSGTGRPRSRGRDKPMTSSVRSVPLKPTNGIPVFDIAPIPEFRLAMTPENIRPLLENARVVTARLQDCVLEVKELLAKAEVGVGMGLASTPTPTPVS